MAHILRRKLPINIQERWEQYKATHQKKLKESAITEAPDVNGYEYDDEIDSDIDAKIAALNKERVARKTIANNARKYGASANKVGAGAKIVLTNYDDDDPISYSLSNIAFGFSEHLRKLKFPHIPNIGYDDAAKAVKEVISNSPRNSKQIAKNLNDSGLGYKNWVGIEDSSSGAVLAVTSALGNKYKLKISYSNNSIDESMVEEKPTPIMTPDETGISLILSNLIKDEWEAIDGYNSAIQTLADLKKDDAITILQDIVKEENVHVGQLEQLLKTFSVDAHDIDKGEQEAEEQLSK